ncbi:hypothetical protein BKA80DRAFT_310881 [Phyllosticta citrichinensis]
MSSPCFPPTQLDGTSMEHQITAQNGKEETFQEAPSASTQPHTTTALYAPTNFLYTPATSLYTPVALYAPATAPSARAYTSSNAPDASEDFDFNRLSEMLRAELGLSPTATSHTAIDHAAAEQNGAGQATTLPSEVPPPSTEPAVIYPQPAFSLHQPELGTTHTDTQKPFSCDFCGSQFTRNASKRRHERCSHADLLDLQNQPRPENPFVANSAAEKPYSCDHCSVRFRERRSKQHHERVAHPEVESGAQQQEEERFSCDYCSKDFKALYNKKRHERENHLAVRSFVCSVCGKIFNRSDALKTHMVMAHGISLAKGPLPQPSTSTMGPYQPLQQPQAEQDQLPQQQEQQDQLPERQTASLEQHGEED